MDLEAIEGTHEEIRSILGCLKASSEQEEQLRLLAQLCWKAVELDDRARQAIDIIVDTEHRPK